MPHGVRETARCATVGVCLAWLLTAPAWAATLAVEDTTGVAGSPVIVRITLDNDVEVRAVQFVLTDMPNHLALVAARTTVRSVALQVDAEEATDGSIEVVLLSLGSNTIAAGDGAVLELDFQILTEATGEPILLTPTDLRVANAAGMAEASTAVGGTVMVELPAPTDTPTSTPTDTPPPTVTPTETATSTPTVPPTITPTQSPSSTPTTSPTLTASRTITPTSTHTATPTFSLTPTRTNTPTATPSLTLTATASPTSTMTFTSTATSTPTARPSDTPTSVPTVTETPTATPSDTPSVAPEPTSTPTEAPTCDGDCNEDNMVAVDDLLTLVNIANGLAPASECPAGDADGDGQISIDDILIAVNNALLGCT